jgi:4-amino-4-deoxy-L-arabinose transferase-like glycosyltransferase
MERIYKRKILILFFSAFFVRIAFILTLKNQFYFDDEYEYFKMVENFLSGKGLIVSENLKAFRPPLYPLILSLLYFLKFNLLGIRIFQTIISSLTVIFIYLLGKEIFDEKTGFFSSLISIFYPFFIFYTGFLLTETLFVFLIVLTFFYLVKIVEKNGNLSLKAGIIMGLAGLTRPNIQLFFLISIFHILFLKDKWKKILLFSAGFCVVLMPWIIRNYKIFHKLIPGTTMGGWVFWEGNNLYSEGGPCSYFPRGILEIEETQRDKILYNMTFKVIKENPKRFLFLMKNKFKRFWNIVPNAPEFERKILYRFISVFSFGILMPFFIIGFFISFKNKKAHFFHSLIIFFTISHMVFLASIRYRLPIEPFYIILSVSGLFNFIFFVKQSFRSFSEK